MARLRSEGGFEDRLPGDSHRAEVRAARELSPAGADLLEAAERRYLRWAANEAATRGELLPEGSPRVPVTVYPSTPPPPPAPRWWLGGDGCWRGEFVGPDGVKRTVKRVRGDGPDL